MINSNNEEKILDLFFNLIYLSMFAIFAVFLLLTINITSFECSRDGSLKNSCKLSYDRVINPITYTFSISELNNAEIIHTWFGYKLQINTVNDSFSFITSNRRTSLGYVSSVSNRINLFIEHSNRVFLSEQQSTSWFYSLELLLVAIAMFILLIRIFIIIIYK